MKVLVTGGAGFVGTNVVLNLISRGHEVTILDDLSTGLRSNVPVGVQFVEESILNRKVLHEIIASVDSVIHLAARGSVPRSIINPVLTHEVNVNGTLNVLEAARLQKRHVIFSSSSSVYGANTHLPKNEEMVLKPLTPYAASKLAGESLMMAYGKSYGLPVTTLRFFNVFGPWQRPDHIYSAVIPKWIWCAMNGETLEVYGDGEQTRDFTSVSVVEEVICRSLEERINHPEPVNLALGNKIKLNQVIDILRENFENLDIKFTGERAGDVHSSQNNPELLRQIFPNLMSNNFGHEINKTIDWMKSEGRKVIGGPEVHD